MVKETAAQKQRRLEKARQKYQEKRSQETEQCKSERLTKRRKMLESEAESRRAERLAKHKEHMAAARALETEEERASRQARDRERHAAVRSVEPEEERASRQARDREWHADARLDEEAYQAELQRRRIAYALRSAGFDKFRKEIAAFCDRTCDICRKKCYQNQVKRYNLLAAKDYLPPELAQKNILEVCYRCESHLKNARNRMAPPKAYWNNLDPGEIPDCIKDLHESEYRLLRRINPYLKVIKFGGRFGQYGFKGQAILFALDIFEVSEKLPNMLPRSSDDSGMVIVTETLENLNISRDFPIRRQYLYAALRWLIAHNPLYKDVQINHFARLEPEDLVRVVPAQPSQQPDAAPDFTAPPTPYAYVAINDASRIIRANWHQGQPEIFTSGYAGVQCFAMVTANIIRASLLPPRQWDTNAVNQNMLAGDDLYLQIRVMSDSSEVPVHAIPEDGYLSLANLDVVRDDIIMYERSFALDYDDFWLCNGSLQDRVNDGVISLTLQDGIARLVEEHNAGVLVVGSKSLGLMHYDAKYYFTDSHACGAKGASAKSNGRACVIECDTMEDFLRIVRRTVGSRNEPYMISYIDVRLRGEFIQVNDYLRMRNLPLEDDISDVDTQPQPVIEADYVSMQTSVMAPIDCVQPDVEDEFVEGENLNEIRRKTRNNIVNVDHDRRAEEFSWYNLFPYGRNGLNEDRPVKITPLDYFQCRVIGDDTRFQRLDYLFYALSMFEFHRAKSTIDACVKKVRGKEGTVEDLHLYMRNLRGSAAYWTQAHNELIAMIRILGPPTWFLTLSCNDLNWRDMRRALLIADGRPDENPESLSLDEVQRLIERYPAVVSRHFSRKVSAFMKYIKANEHVLGGKVKDYWWRIEFQNRGSPHIHMVIWLENAPSFETEEGFRLIDEVISCHFPSQEEDSVLHDLVKRNQIHRHTHTCYKNSNNNVCRFCFPRQPCNQTRILSHTSDEFIRNGGRTCVLRRRPEDSFVNNYNRAILELWDANMDIQPCGNDERIAYYIGKYISKNEPTNLNEGIAQAIRQIRREETNISRKMFKICMRILHERQVSACECVFRLCHLPLRGSTRSCVFVNTRKPDERYHCLQFDGDQATGVASNIIDRYSNRPRQHPDYNFQDMCLLEFAMLFEAYYAKKSDNTEESVDEEQPTTTGKRKLVSLTDNTKVALRNTPAVVRVPYFQMSNDPERTCYALLMQYQPYYGESELLEGFDSARDAFLAREQQLKDQSRYIEALRRRDQLLQNAFTQARAFTLLQPEEAVEADVDLEELPDHAMTDEQFQSASAALNIQQRDLFTSVTRSIQSQLSGETQRLRLFVTGGAGTGKTFTFNALKNQVNRCYGKTAVKVAALTGVAARLVGGSTLHSMLKIPVQRDGVIVVQMPQLTGNYLRVMRQQWRDIEFFFIDEISMVPYEMLCMIDSRLRQLKNKPDEVFGGLNMMVFGDLMQLPPVRASCIFKQPIRFQPAVHLWQLFRLVELTENMRQRGDTTFADLLNALRVGKLTGHHFDILMSKILTEPTGEFALDKAIRIYPTRALVDAHNNAVLEYYRTVEKRRIYTIVAQDRITESTRNTDNVDMSKIVSDDINKTGALPKSLEIFVGAKVMLRSNINVERGLVNGSIGNITEIHWPYYRRDQVDDRDIPAVSIDFGRDGIHRIEPKCVEFPAKMNYGTVERRMLPLILCWACTAHKMQGCTVDHAVVYLAKLFEKGQAYVMLSRVRSLDGVRIERLDCQQLTGTTPCNTDALEEMERLRQYQPPNDPE